MPAKKKTTTKKTDKKCCNCDGCCSCSGGTNFGVTMLVSVLAIVLTVLVIACGVNYTILNHKSPYAKYKGTFTTESIGDQKDESGIVVLSASGVIDMLIQEKDAFLIVGEENCLGCDVFARRVANELDSTKNVYRYNAHLESTDADKDAKELLGTDNDAPYFIYIKDGYVFDRIDDVKSIENLRFFLEKYGAALKNVD